MSAIGKLFAPPPPPQQMIMPMAPPKPPPAPVMPDLGSPAMKEETLARMASRRGSRSSTILGGSDSGGMGSGDYSKTKLGG